MLRTCVFLGERTVLRGEQFDCPHELRIFANQFFIDDVGIQSAPAILAKCLGLHRAACRRPGWPWNETPGASFQITQWRKAEKLADPDADGENYSMKIVVREVARIRYW